MEILKGSRARASIQEDDGVCDVVTSAGLLLLRFYGGLELSTKMKQSLSRSSLHHKTFGQGFMRAWQVVYLISAVNQCALALP
eukprot:4790787-Prymnesium_polylepis.1